METLIPKEDNPFYIVSPAYTRASAGINALYILCHYLNRAGERAFIVNYPPDQAVIKGLSHASASARFDTPGALIAPPLTQDVIDFYDQKKITPVVIYPEVFDNPLDAPFFGRFILNYPGKASLSSYAAEENFAFAYSRILADHCTALYADRGPVEDVLFIPTMDLGFWNTVGQAPIRSGTCFYAGKMRRVHDTFPENVPDGSVEIHNHKDMTPAEIRGYFRRSEVFYCYEDSALAIEAQLCGCPTVFVPNSLFDGTPLASMELGHDGSFILGENGGLQRARSTVGRVEAKIRNHMEHVPGHIAALARKYKAQAKLVEYRGTINYPFEPRIFFLPKFGRSLDASGTMELSGMDRVAIREIAREVWYEKNRLGLPYKTLKLFKTWRSNRKKKDVVASPTARTLPAAEGEKVPSDVRRIVLFAHFDRDGLIDDYVIHYLKSLNKVAQKILFMSDCELRVGEAQKLRGVAELVFAGSHGEYDFGSWKRGFVAMDYDFSKWDELIIANDSCYAPLFPLEDTFDLIGDCDFWSATKEPYSRLAADIAANRAEEQHTRAARPADLPYAEEDFDFLNTYFVVFRNEIIRDPAFLDFWRRIEQQKDKDRVIELYEIGLTKLLRSLGYTFSCFAVRAGAVIYDHYEVPAPAGFDLPWLRVLICKENRELIPNLDSELHRINYPRSLIDKHIERMTGSAHPAHYFLSAKRPSLSSGNLGAFWKGRRVKAGQGSNGGH